MALWDIWEERLAVAIVVPITDGAVEVVQVILAGAAQLEWDFNVVAVAEGALVA